MSENDGAMTASKPKSASAQTACSREEPRAEVRPGDEDRVGLELDLAVADPVVEEELAEAGPLDPLQELLGDDLVGVDVGAVEHRDLPLDHVDGLIGAPPFRRSSLPVPDVDEAALDRRGGGHPRADQMGPPALALAALEVPVRGRGAALALDQDVGVHAEAHRAARCPPLEAGGAEDLVQALVLGRAADLLGAGDDHRPDARRRPCGPRPSHAAARRSSIREFVHEPMKTRSSAISVIGVPGSSAM